MIQISTFTEQADAESENRREKGEEDQSVGAYVTGLWDKLQRHLNPVLTSLSFPFTLLLLCVIMCVSLRVPTAFFCLFLFLLFLLSPQTPTELEEAKYLGLFQYVDLTKDFFFILLRKHMFVHSKP